MRLRSRLAASFFLALALPGAGAHAQPAPTMNGEAPAVSPDGARVAFLSERGGTTDIWVIGADGTGETRVTNTPEVETQPDWSPDGTELRFTVFADGASRIFSIRLDGTNRKLLGTVPGRAMRLTPDAKRVLYWTGTWTAMKLFSSNLDGSEARPLTDGTGVVWGSRWSRDAKRIAFADREPNGPLHVWLMNADGSARNQLTHFPPDAGSAQMPAWSSDGGKLAVQTSAKGRPGHVWIVDAATGDAKKLAAHDALYQDEVPAWFPDGRRIAFQSDRSGRMEIWVMNADGTGAHQLTK